MKKVLSIFSASILVMPVVPLQAQKIKITNLPSLGFYTSADVYKGFVWQGPGDNMSLGTSVGNSTGKVALYNNGILNMSLSNLGVMEVSGNFPQVRVVQNGNVAGQFNAAGINAELSAYRSQNGSRGNLLLQLDVNTDLVKSYTGNVGIKTNNPVNILQIGDAIGFSGNQLAIGNGTKGMSFFQNATTSYWYSSTNFALMPNAGGAGRVGIGTATPVERLDVASGNLRLQSGNLILNSGNVKVESGNVTIQNGKLLNPATGSVDLKPLCYGRIGSDGSIKSGTTNFTITHSTAFDNGSYSINCPQINASSVILLTIEELGTGLGQTYTATGGFSEAGKMFVLTTNLSDLIFNPDSFLFTSPRQFYFVIYNP